MLDHEDRLLDGLVRSEMQPHGQVVAGVEPVDGDAANEEFDGVDGDLAVAASAAFGTVAGLGAKHGLGVLVDDVGRVARHADRAVVKPDRPVAEVADGGCVVGDEDEGASLLAKVDKLFHALLLEGDVANGEDLVDQQQFGIDVDCHGEREPHVHARRVRLDRVVDELPKVGEVDDLIKTLGDLLTAHAQDGGVEKDVVASAQLLVEPGTEFEERGHPLGDLDVARVRCEDAGHALEQGRLARTVVADDAERLAGFDIERDVTRAPRTLRSGCGRQRR